MAASVAAKKFRVLGLQQIAVGGLSKPELSALWQGAFGLTKIGTFKSERENVVRLLLLLLLPVVTLEGRRAC